MGLIVSKLKKVNGEKTALISKKPELNFKKNDTSKIKSRLRTAKNRLHTFFKKGMTTASWVIWVAGVSAVVIVTPIAFQYEKECQLFEMQAQFFQAQQAASAPQLN